MFSITARYSRASSTAEVEFPASSSPMGSTSTHRARPVPGTAVPNRARPTPRTATAAIPPGRSPRSVISATTPTDAYRPSMNGTITSEFPAATAASTAAMASSDSRAMVKTIPGSRTPEVKGSRGRLSCGMCIRPSVSTSVGMVQRPGSGNIPRPGVDHRRAPPPNGPGGVTGKMELRRVRSRARHPLRSHRGTGLPTGGQVRVVP